MNTWLVDATGRLINMATVNTVFVEKTHSDLYVTVGFGTNMSARLTRCDTRRAALDTIDAIREILEDAPDARVVEFMAYGRNIGKKSLAKHRASLKEDAD